MRIQVCWRCGCNFRNWNYIFPLVLVLPYCSLQFHFPCVVWKIDGERQMVCLVWMCALLSFALLCFAFLWVAVSKYLKQGREAFILAHGFREISSWCSRDGPQSMAARECGSQMLWWRLLTGQPIRRKRARQKQDWAIPSKSEPCLTSPHQDTLSAIYTTF